MPLEHGGKNVLFVALVGGRFFATVQSGAVQLDFDMLLYMWTY